MSGPRALNETLGDFQAKRAATMSPDALKINVDQRRRLVETADRDGFVKCGDTVAQFELIEAGGAILTRDALLRNGPLVLIFFRFAGCPACNIALPYYNQYLAPELARLGATLVAVSPQIPERLGAIKERNQLDFSVASDRNNALGRRFGILYTFDEASREASIASGKPIGDVTGTGTFELPMPAVIIIDQEFVVRFADVSPDWLERTEPVDIIAAVRKAIPLARSEETTKLQTD